MTKNEVKAENFTERLEGFVNAVKTEYNVSLYPSVGRKFVRMERGGSVFCFVEIATGNVLKAESWAKPALHARSNINDADFGLSGVTEYGAKYLK